jgi:hypothetical protein
MTAASPSSPVDLFCRNRNAHRPNSGPSGAEWVATATLLSAWRHPMRKRKDAAAQPGADGRVPVPLPHRSALPDETRQLASDNPRYQPPLAVSQDRVQQKRILKNLDVVSHQHYNQGGSLSRRG